MKIRYGTRGSALAVAQSGWLAGELCCLHPGLEVEKVIIQTSGDRFSLAMPDAPYKDDPQGAGAGREAPNVKAMFVKELEEALLAGTIDFAIHSSKDLPGELPPRLGVAAYPEREDPRDVYIGSPAAPTWKDIQKGSPSGKPGLRVATAALRRQIQLGISAPGVSFVTMRGNVDTRLRKLGEGAADGLVLAKAGLKRLGRDCVPHEVLTEEVIVPAPGQGALAVEARLDRKDIMVLLSAADHAPTRLEVECERAFLRLMGGGCRTPLGAWARTRSRPEAEPDASLDFLWFWSDDSGKHPERGSFTCPADLAVFQTRAAELATKLRRRTNP
ncbi:MAG: hydroxymethylbilane synthase [Elusimicrobia bacterium]|nr:hydroxymethylbilane synthase [Elusimicrobiota bacterium]